MQERKKTEAERRKATMNKMLENFPMVKPM